MSIVLMGSTSGSITLSEPAVAGSTTLNLPASSGTVVVGSSAVSAAGQIPFSTDGSTYTPTAKIVSGTVNGGAANPLSGGSTVDFTSIPSWVKRITVMFSGVSLSGTDEILVQLGVSGNYSATYASTSALMTSSNGLSSSTTGFVIRYTAATQIISGLMVITNITGNSWVASGNGKSSTTLTFVSGGDVALSGAVTSVRVTVTGTNTFDAGSINILYE